MALHLSKSKYCSAVQCPKMLWLSRNRPELFDARSMDQAALERGNMVGDLAMGLFGDFTEVPFGDLGNMIDTTARLISEGTGVIAEASFSHNGLFCSVDILKNFGAGAVALYEVKSSTSLKDIYYDDVAYQVYVLTALGYRVQRACLAHIDNTYVRHGELDIQKLFAIEDITDEVMAKQPEVMETIDALGAYMQQTEEPICDIGEHCFKPYDCGFWNHCSRHLPSPSVFDVAGLSLAKKCQCYDEGLVSFADLNTCNHLSPKQYQQVEHQLYQYSSHIDADSIRDFLNKLSYPLYFLDFESFQPAIPLYENSKPFEQIVFQYSLHYIEHEGGDLKHTEFLAYPGADPRRALAEQLCRDIPKDVCVTAYNMAFEKTRIKGLAEIYPDLAAHLMNIHDHIEDLMIPFQRRYYYDKAMEGSYSIKYVLPALFPGDPSLDYHNLEGIHNGGEASNAFAAMENMDAEAMAVTRQQLLKYCGLDTFAMVKVWEKLHAAANSPLKITW